MTNPLGQGPARTLDANGRATSLQTPGGHQYELEHDAAGRVISASADGATYRMEYDAVDRVISRNRPGRNRETLYTYTPAGRPATIERSGDRWSFEHDPCGRLTKATNPDGTTRQFGYDRSSRLVSLILSNGDHRQLRWGPQGRPVEITTNGHALRYEFDPKGRVTAVLRGDQTLRSGTYDAAGRQIAVKDGLGNTTTIQRDERGRPRWTHWSRWHKLGAGARPPGQNRRPH